MPGVIATPAFAPLCVDGKTMDDVLSDYAPKHPMGRVRHCISVCVFSCVRVCVMFEGECIIRMSMALTLV